MIGPQQEGCHGRIQPRWRVDRSITVDEVLMSLPSSKPEALTLRHTVPNRFRNATVLVFALVTLCALILRLHHLDHESLFMDELLQVSHYEHGLGVIIEKAALQQQTPLDYWIGHFVYRFSRSDWAVRLPAALFGTGSVFLAMLIVARRCAWGTTAVAGALMALLPFNLYYSQQARPYAIAVFFLLALVAMLVFVLDGPRFRWWLLPLLLLVTTGFLYSRALSPLVVVTVLFTLLAARCGAGLVRHGFKADQVAVRCGWAACVIALSLLIYVPAFMFVLSKGERYVSVSTPLLETITRGLSEFTLVPLWRAHVAQMEPIGYMVLPLVMLWALLGGCRRSGRDIEWPLVVALLLVGSALVNIFVFKAKSSTPFRPPYAIYILPLMLILSASAFQGLWDAADGARWRHSGRWLLAAVACCTILWTGYSAWQFKLERLNTDWRGLAQSLQDRYATGQVLLFDSITKYGSWEPTFWGFDRYYSGSSPRIPLYAVSDSAPALAKSAREPVFILFVYPQYSLTPRSRYPVMDAPRTSVPVDLRGLAEYPSLNVQKFVGFHVISLANPTGRLGADTLTIVERLIQELPRNSCAVELHLAAASLRCALNRPQWTEHLQSAVALAPAAMRDRVAKVTAVIRARLCP